MRFTWPPPPLLPRHDTHLNTRMFAIGRRRRRRHHLTWAQQRTGGKLLLLLLESEDAVEAKDEEQVALKRPATKAQRCLIF